MNATGAAAAGATALAARFGIQINVDAHFRTVESVTDIFDDKTCKVLHAADECFNGELNGGCGVVCSVATPTNARGRHSQAQKTRRCQSGKAKGFCRAKPVAVSGRSPQPLSSGPAYKSPTDIVGRQRTEFYAVGPLDSGEERASSHLQGPFTV
ncbi:MAG: hypothetical protein MUF86_10755 [Akkermansiaceae bacterium]|nr:hypothetical protein [Akkermansiaceae bacterium]